MQSIKDKNLYELLGIDSNASSSQIKKAYFLKIREFPNETYPEEFQALTKAYKTLSNEEARTQYDHEIQDNGAYSKLIALANESMSKEQYNSALYTLEDMLKTYPNDITIKQQMAICYMNLDRDEEAKKILLPLEENNPNDEMTLNLVGQLYYKLKLYKLAEVRYSKLVTLNPREKNYFISLANIYVNLGEHVNALTILEENLNQGKETVYDFPLFEHLFFITMIADKPSYHKKVIIRIKKLPSTSEEKSILLNMLMNSIDEIDNENIGFKELVQLVKDINGGQDSGVNEWLKNTESYIRSDILYYGETQLSYQNSNPSTNYSQSVSSSTMEANYDYQERGSFVFAVILGIITSFIFTPIGGIIIGFIWYFNAGSLKKVLNFLGCLAVIIVFFGIIILSNM